MRYLFYPFVIVIVLSNTLSAQSLQLSSGFDTRFRKADGEVNSFELHGSFVNLRKVFSDELGDRLILVTQYDFEDNFSESHFYYTYAQVKGPLGKINLRVGRYVIPFGLLTYYDTERLLLQTLEKQSLDIKTDVGAQVFGYFGDLDYALSISNGVGRYWKDIDDNKLIIARLGLNVEDSRLGFSYLNGKVFTPVTRGFSVEEYLYKERFALDAQQSIDLFTVRAEAIYGRDERETVAGGFLGIDYSLLPDLDLNFKHAFWSKQETQHLGGIGFSYTLLSGAYVRFADNFRIVNKGIKDNAVQFQIYIEFLNHL